MNDDDLHALLPALEDFHGCFGRFFRRSEGRAFRRQYLIGLTLPIERKNAENIAEQVGAPARKLQAFLSDSPWDDEGCIGELQLVGEQFGAPDGVLIVDDTGFAKKGSTRPAWAASTRAPSGGSTTARSACSRAMPAATATPWSIGGCT